ncbi:hypothetical protein GCM10007304_22790 [Rhodococcoides trifolii]|uniref:Uncharacterized protein n=1 Tax=Rhodococcoides trifolii TaxID=908250 RepID=A0A917D390_9NOCA|nr:hypothetical protein [Rhodococcus trifolii]GGG08140.1 hypothetical protein GCM10007304_22790 [Rhodococcus trifolii]
MRRALALTAALFVMFPGTAAAQDLQFGEVCTPTDPGLSELSGTTELGGFLYGMGDSGADDRVAEMDPSTCAVVRWIPNPVDPYDVEDLSHYGNSLWLADIGDNDSIRSTVALTRLDPADGAGELHRLAYPDGPHDAETLLVGRDAIPVIVTKVPSGVSGIYSAGVPVDQLASPGPTALMRVGDVTLAATSTTGGPPLIQGSLLVTGGAVSADGTVVALRTYTDLYLYWAPDGNVVSALMSGPTKQVPLPAQPQGESLAFTENGDLLFGSEEGFTPTTTLPPIGVLRGATAVAAPAKPVADEQQSSLPTVVWVLVAGGVVALVILGSAVLAVKRRR